MSVEEENKLDTVLLDVEPMMEEHVVERMMEPVASSSEGGKNNRNKKEKENRNKNKTKKTKRGGHKKNSKKMKMKMKTKKVKGGKKRDTNKNRK